MFNSGISFQSCEIDRSLPTAHDSPTTAELYSPGNTSPLSTTQFPTSALSKIPTSPNPVLTSAPALTATPTVTPGPALPPTPTPAPTLTPTPTPTNAPALTPSPISQPRTRENLELMSGIPDFEEQFDPVTLLPGTTATTPANFFALIFTDDVIAHIVFQTKLYARQCPPPSAYEWEECTPERLKSFLGLVILMGLKRVPSLPDYWSTTNLLGCPELVHRWPYRKFRGLLTCIHLNDNRTMVPSSSPNFDRLHKVRPVVEMVRKNCIEEYRPIMKQW